jgi:hypothetical protein
MFRTAIYTAIRTARLTLLAALAVPALVACGGAPRQPISTTDVDAVASEKPEVAPPDVDISLYALNAERTAVYLIALSIDDVAAWPVAEPLAIDPDTAIRAEIRAVGDIPTQSPVCQFIDNPLPEDVNPCVESITLYGTAQPTALSGVLELSANDDVVAGTLHAFLGADDTVAGSFHQAR